MAIYCNFNIPPQPIIYSNPFFILWWLIIFFFFLFLIIFISNLNFSFSLSKVEEVVNYEKVII